MSRVEIINAAFLSVAKRRRLPFNRQNAHSWGSSLNADIGRFELRRELKRAGVGTPELRERWIKEIT